MEVTKTQFVWFHLRHLLVPSLQRTVVFYCWCTFWWQMCLSRCTICAFDKPIQELDCSHLADAIPIAVPNVTAIYQPGNMLFTTTFLPPTCLRGQGSVGSVIFYTLLWMKVGTDKVICKCVVVFSLIYSVLAEIECMGEHKFTQKLKCAAVSYRNQQLVPSPR